MTRPILVGFLLGSLVSLASPQGATVIPDTGCPGSIPPHISDPVIVEKYFEFLFLDWGSCTPEYTCYCDGPSPSTLSCTAAPPSFPRSCILKVASLYVGLPFPGGAIIPFLHPLIPFQSCGWAVGEQPFITGGAPPIPLFPCTQLTSPGFGTIRLENTPCILIPREASTIGLTVVAQAISYNSCPPIEIEMSPAISIMIR